MFTVANVLHLFFLVGSHQSHLKIVLEVVGRSSDTQLQAGKNFNAITLRF